MHTRPRMYDISVADTLCCWQGAVSQLRTDYSGTRQTWYIAGTFCTNHTVVNERLNNAVFKSWPNTLGDEADLTHNGTPFQTCSAATENQEVR